MPALPQCATLRGHALRTNPARRRSEKVTKGRTVLTHCDGFEHTTDLGSSSAGTLHYSATFTQVPVKHEECPVQKDIMHTSIDGQDSSDNDVDDGQDNSDNDVEKTQETSARFYCMASSVLVLQQGVTRDLVQERIRTVIYSNRARHRTVYGTLHIPVRQHRIDSFQTCYICFIILFSSNLLYC